MSQGRKKKQVGKSKPGPKKGTGGRPRKVITPEQIKQVERMAGLGMDQDSISQVLGISSKTFRNRKAEDEALSTAYKKGRAQGLEMATSKLFGLVRDGHPASIYFFLKTQHGWKETHKVESKNEVTGKDGGPIEVSTFKPEEMGDDELRRIAEGG